ncbi:MAG: hypothetical protein RIM80_01490, partial [Alphaproteobacteria bacterium]
GSMPAPIMSNPKASARRPSKPAIDSERLPATDRQNEFTNLKHGGLDRKGICDVACSDASFCSDHCAN